MPDGFEEALGQIRTSLSEHARRTLDRPRQAAVLVPLLELGGEPCLLLTRRAEDHLSHRGQVAFPGGHSQFGDRDETATALREAREEIGLDPQAVRPLGLLDDFVTLENTTAVTPVIARVEDPGELTPEPREVARIFSIPICELLKKDQWRRTFLERDGARWPIYHLDWDGETLWGMSAAITLALLDLSPWPTPWPPPPRRR